MDKLDPLSSEHFFNDTRNIDIEDGEEIVPVEMKALIEDWKNSRMTANGVSGVENLHDM